MSKLLTQNGKILITSAGALAIESAGGGGYDITATVNEDGTQSLAIVDGQGGSSGGTTIEKSTVNITVNQTNAPEDWSIIVSTPDDLEIIELNADNLTQSISVAKGYVFIIESWDDDYLISRASSGGVFDTVNIGPDYGSLDYVGHKIYSCIATESVFNLTLAYNASIVG